MVLKSNEKLLITSIKDLNDCLVHVEYLLANGHLSFIDSSTLNSMKRTLFKGVNSISKLVDPKLLEQIEPSKLVCTKCESEYPIKYADSQQWEYCPRCGETFL
ncbi:hypothetical protein F938_02050 [Acinetobacter bereziniae LMG 1003 = CIP 70.12]|uniref:Uncharacterized protein n=1 Tax=Acinetobacter bereziniae LMG 1003 = CIP 70.12 TaxID=981324 RepID=N9DFS0_ACIBZ|nr:hypothetical protein [Acinetobacter bereziniae]ENV96646.1 hypothetical protein F938_02050 [Acinetobacter bereziniae LMG 1003 = CIP 70.12]